MNILKKFKAKTEKKTRILNKEVKHNGRSLIRRHETPMNDPHEWNADIFKDDIIAIDFETNGLDALAKDFKVVGVGLASKSFPNGMYFSIGNDFETGYVGELQILWEGLQGKKLIMHNANFDSRIMDKFITKDYSLLCDTAIAYRMIGSEDKSMRHGLKSLSQEVLGWDEAYEQELYDWLKVNDLKPKDMWQAPDHILGKYCAMDAQATFALYNVWKDNYIPKFPAIEEAMELTMDLQHVVNEAFFRGMAVDKYKLEAYIEELNEEVDKLQLIIYSYPEVIKFCQSKMDTKYYELKDKEPPMYTKTGKVASRYTKWEEKINDLVNQPIYSMFKLTSKPQLAEFFSGLYTTTRLSFTRKNKKTGETETYYKIKWFVDGKEFISAATPKGQIKVDKSVLPKLGEVGKLLNDMNGLIKLRGYAESMLKSLNPTLQRGRMEPFIQGIPAGEYCAEVWLHNTDMRPWSSLNGRPTGGGNHHDVNILQIPKVKGYQDCLVPRPHHKLIEMDYNSLEPTILAETSKDPTYIKLYGDKTYPNDAYIELMYNIPMFKQLCIDRGYPSLDSVKVIKKECKKERTVTKPIQLGLGFGMGTPTLQYNLSMMGYDFTLDEVQEMVDAYRRTYHVLLNEYQPYLQSQIDNKGYFLNSLGVPRCLNEDTKKDVLNAQSQGSGNLIQMKHSYEINKLRKERGVQLYPIVASFYDELVWECPDAHVDAAVKIFEDALANVNEWLDGDFPIEGEVEVADCFSDFKL